METLPESVLSPREKAKIHMDAAQERWGRRCSKCSLGPLSKHPPLWGSGNPAAPIMVVDMNTTYSEAQANQKYAPSQYGTALPELMAMVWGGLGLHPGEDIYAANVMKCPRQYQDGEGNRKEPVPPTSQQIDACKVAFRRQFDIVKPALLVVQGKEANAAVLGDTRSMNQFLGHIRQFGPSCVALSTHSPMGLLMGERMHLRSEFFEHWRQGAIRLNCLGRMWRPGADIFARGWSIGETPMAA